ncbi:hypothetical protein JCM6882_008516 [Rhodosporidiobolus microsporus]
MVRILTAAALLLPALHAVVASPPDLVADPLSDTYCEDYTQGDTTDVQLCAPLFTLTGTLLFTSGSVSGNLEKTLAGVTDLLGGDTSPLGSLLGGVTNGLLGNLGFGVGGVLDTVSQLLQGAAPQCKCDLGACYTKLTSSLETARSADDEATVSSACSVAMYNCAPYYSTTDILEVIPECAEFFCDAATDPECTSSTDPTEEMEEEESADEEARLKKRSSIQKRGVDTMTLRRNVPWNPRNVAARAFQHKTEAGRMERRARNGRRLH